MKKIMTGAIFTAAILGFIPLEANAIPTLQLDIDGGKYDHETETITIDVNNFTLYALLKPDTSNTLDDTYYISAALTPGVSSPGSLGYFRFNGNTVNATSGMTQGVPPAEANGHDAGDLGKHGIFPTYFKEFDFQFNSSNRMTAYNSQERAENGGSINTAYNPYGYMYFTSFDIDTSYLGTGYELHFDLYNTKVRVDGDVDVTKFAPFSHDAETVPEPGTLFLIGSGLTGLYFTTRRLRR